MATITQRLAFLVSANADQAIKAFDKTAATAEKQMGKAGKSIDKLGASMTKFGAAGLAAAGTLGTGLFKLAQGAIEDQKAQALLAEQLRNTADATDGQIKAVEEMIDATARATGVADDQLRPAMGNLVRGFGDVQKASSVLSTALDIQAATGRDLETITIALSRAASGNVGALSRLGIPLDENVKKSKDFGAALVALNQQFGGAAAARAETYAGKLDRTKVALSEAGEAVGTAFIPVIEDLSSIVIKGVGAFDDFNNTTDGLAGKVLALGTVGLGAVSALSLVGGQAIKVRNVLFELDEVTGKSTLSLSKLGKGLLGAGLIIGGAAVVYEAYSNKKQQAEQRTRELAEALKLEGDAQRQALGELAKNDDRTRQHINTLNLLGLTVGDMKTAIDGGKTSFDRIRGALEEYQKRLGYAGAERAFADAIGYQGDLTVGQINAIASLTKEVDRQVAAQKDAAAAFDETNKALGDLGYTYEDVTAAFERNYKWNEMRNRSVDRSAALAEYQSMLEERASKTAGLNDEKRAKAAEAYAKRVDTLADKLETKLAKALSNAEENAANANKAFSDYQKTIAGSVTGVVSLGEAQATAETNTKKLAEAKQAEVDAQTELNKALTAKDADPEKIAEARQKLADATKAVTDAEKAPLTFGDALKGQVTTATDFKSNLQKVLDLGGDQALVDQLTAAGADAGNAIIKGILASSDPKAKVDELDQTLANVAALGDAIGKASAEKFYGEGVKLANELLRGVSEQLSGINVDKVKGGKNAIKNLKKLDKNLKNTPVDTSLGLILGAQVPSLADGGIVPARPGGTLVRVGEGGQDEAVLPLPRMQGGATINLYVTAGMGADGTQIGRQIVDELVAYQRRVGALPIKVAG